MDDPVPVFANERQTDWRFWSRVNKTDGCWLWTGATAKRYGILSVNGRTQRAHRVSWLLHYGDVPDGVWVLHKCDNPPCVRPDHLFLGTASDNTQDMMSKGRHGSQTSPTAFPRGDQSWSKNNPDKQARGERSGPAVAARKRETCRRGHQYSGVTKSGSRSCNLCKNESQRRRRMARNKRDLVAIERLHRDIEAQLAEWESGGTDSLPVATVGAALRKILSRFPARAGWGEIYAAISSPPTPKTGGG